MANIAEALRRLRSYGANITLDQGKLVIVNAKKLPAGAVDYIRQHAKDITRFLSSEADYEERAAIMQYDGGLTQPVAEYLTRLLMASPPAEANPAEWTWFVGAASKIVDDWGART